MLSAGVRGGWPVPHGLDSHHTLDDTQCQVCGFMPFLALRANLHTMKRDPLPVRERTRRAVRDELTQLAKDLFVEKGYDETTIDDLAAAAGMSRRTFFRYFASKEELVMGKY